MPTVSRTRNDRNPKGATLAPTKVTLVMLRFSGAVVFFTAVGVAETVTDVRIGGAAVTSGAPATVLQSTVPEFTCAIALLNGPYEPFRVPSAQSRPDCHPPSTCWSSSMKLKSAWMYGWQYVSRSSSLSCVAWSGAGLASGGDTSGGSGETTSGTGPGQFSSPK